VHDADGQNIVYLTFEDFVRAAAEALGTDQSTIRGVANETLAGSALAAPAAGFGDFQKYPLFATQAAVLLRAVASNHSLPDGNKRTALLCTVLFANLNGFRWEPPEGDDPEGTETAEVVEAAATRTIPLGALSAWVGDRLVAVPLPLPQRPADRRALVMYPAEFIGPLAYDEHSVQIGDLTIDDVHGYNPAGVYVRRVSGKTEGISVGEIIISVVGDGYAQEELDVENEEAERYPLGAKEFWRARLVGKAMHGRDHHPMTAEEFEADWAESEQD
jgi:death-on-curing protein